MRAFGVWSASTRLVQLVWCLTLIFCVQAFPSKGFSSGFLATVDSIFLSCVYFIHYVIVRAKVFSEGIFSIFFLTSWKGSPFAKREKEKEPAIPSRFCPNVDNWTHGCFYARSHEQELYVSSTKRQKMAISRSIVEAVRSLEPPGRFLEKDPATGLWSDIGHKKAVEKTSQALRDGAASLRKQLSADLGDPDFLNAVFDMEVEGKEIAGKSGRGQDKLKDSDSEKLGNDMEEDETKNEEAKEKDKIKYSEKIPKVNTSGFSLC